MGKKRKGRSAKANPSEVESRNEKTKLLVNSFEDVANSDDEFHISRDEVLLDEGPARKRQRQLEEDEEFLEASDEEILPIPSSASSSDDEESQHAGTDAVGSRRQPLSDKSEVERESEEDLDKEGWGTSRKDYYDADIIETEADALQEEEEALRLQKKQLQGMTEADFGFDETEWLDFGKADQGGVSEDDRVIEEVLPQPEITDEMTLEEKNRILAARYPEFEPLAKEFLELQDKLEQARLNSLAAQKVLEARSAKDKSVASTMPSALLRWTALSTYLSALSMYFAILTSGPLNSEGRQVAKTPIEMRNHPIMESLMRSRTLWHKVKDLRLPDPIQEAATETDGRSHMANGTESHELTPAALVSTEPKRKRKRKSKAQKEAVKALEEAATRQAERLRQSEANLAELSRRASRVQRSTSTKPSQPARISKDIENDSHSDFDFGEDAAPDDDPSATRRKKSLQFYTSQLAQKANKRSAASRNAGGDDDIPYRERFKDRQARLNAQAEVRGRKKVDALGDSSADEEDARVAAELRNGASADGGGEGDYYATIASATVAKKADKAARREAHRQAALVRGAEVREVEEIGPDGKRAISYAIEKNKGLTPRRKKEVRNPRVKKRKRFEDKMKKLGSIRQIYRGGEGRGGYGGEMTGIKTGLVRSVKL